MLPGGPSAGPLAQTVALHRDSLGVLRRARARHGDVFTLRLATVRPIVIVARSSEVEPLLTADSDAAHAGGGAPPGDSSGVATLDSSAGRLPRRRAP